MPEAENASSVAPVMGDYERRRLDNIKRNNAKLRSLGLISALEEKRSNEAAAGILQYNSTRDRDTSDDEEWSEKEKGKRKRKRKALAKKEPKEGCRKSLRLQAISCEDLESLPKVRTDRESMLKEREERVKECREARLRAAKAVAECGAEAAGKKNPTATYEHCLMRVKSMTEKGLANRVKAIERAAGKHSIIKMGIFKSCLQDEGLWPLAELASEALERLKELIPIPE